MEQSLVNPEVRARILAAIEELYDERGRGDQFPTQHEVRTRAKADMNSCSAVFREWKRQQTAKPALVAVEVPEAVKHAHLDAVAIVWAAANEEANANLHAAEAKWEVERADNDTMRRELADAYETAMASAEQAQAALADTQRTNAMLVQKNEDLVQQLSAARESLAQQQTRADENERRAEDLKHELMLAHEQTANVRQELSQARHLHLSEIQQQKAAAAEQIERLNETLAASKARLESANEQAQSSQAALSEVQAKLASALAQAESSTGDLQRLRSALEVKQQQADELQEQVATLAAEHGALQRSHETLRDEAKQSRQLAEHSSLELAKVSGVLQEVQRQNTEFMARLAPTKLAK